MGPKKDNDSSKVKRKNTNIMIDVKKEIIANMKMVFVSLILLLSLGWQNQRSVLFLKTERQSRKPMFQEE